MVAFCLEPFVPSNGQACGVVRVFRVVDFVVSVFNFLVVASVVVVVRAVVVEGTEKNGFVYLFQ